MPALHSRPKIFNIQTVYLVVYVGKEVIIRDLAFDTDFFKFPIKDLLGYYINCYLLTVIWTKV